MRKTILLLSVLGLLLSACAAPMPAPKADAATKTSYPPVATAMTPKPGCQSFAARPTPAPDDPSIFRPVGSSDWRLGPEDAAVTIVVYNDFQSSAGAELAALLAQLRERHLQDLRLVYRPAPKADFHDKALLAAQAAEAAGTQGKFWEMHDLLFARQVEWSGMTPAAFERWLSVEAIALGLDEKQLQSDLKGEKIVARVQQGWEFIQQTGLLLTPFLLINGQIYNGPLEAESLERVVSLIALGKLQFTTCPELTINPARQYVATLETEKGEIVIQLFADKAPLTVNSFVFLARNGWYDNITWHRILPGFVAQTGDPSGTGAGNPGYYFSDEIDNALNFDRPGLVAMANSGANTNGSQFFITLAAAPHLNGRHTIFGEVLSGMEVLEQLSPRDPQPGIYLPPGDALLSIRIEER